MAATSRSKKSAPPTSTLLLLVRHGQTPTTGATLPGRAKGLHLAETGRAQAGAVAARIAHRHELLTQLLRFFALPEDVIFRDVEGMEHHISGETLAALERLTKHLEAHPEIVAELRR